MVKFLQRFGKSILRGSAYCDVPPIRVYLNINFKRSLGGKESLKGELRREYKRAKNFYDFRVRGAEDPEWKIRCSREEFQKFRAEYKRALTKNADETRVFTWTVNVIRGFSRTDDISAEVTMIRTNKRLSRSVRARIVATELCA